MESVAEQRVGKVLHFLLHYGQIPGEQHKMWVIDQAVRELCGDDYNDVIAEYESICDCDDWSAFCNHWNTGSYLKG